VLEEADFELPKVVLTALEILHIGLRLVNFTCERINRIAEDSTTNADRFRKHCGVDHFVAAQMFEDLQITEIEEARLDENKISIKCYLIAMHFVKVYDVEGRREPIFDLSPKTMREWVWHCVEKIQNLKHEKIVWPDDCLADDVWIASVDTTDCPIEEKMHPTLSQDSQLFSFKLNGAGLRHECAIDLFSSRIIWMNGPFLPGVYNDNTIFAEKGLKEKLAAIGKKVLGDKMCNGHPEECSTFNALDTKPVKIMKARIQMRHEQFNNVVKSFNVMKHAFRHKPNKIEKHKMCFEAATVMCCYRMEHGEPLFDLLAGL